ncbi:thiamine diphosphokinase [Phaeovulum sp. W22_SRMD_FR3]|uniref:thiamine diphosphokinase n=1 Tax=Phaeovulum sp. W22_SRMD_FR3 TaxID=3240274 RepID=UPI003F9E5B85
MSEPLLHFQHGVILMGGGEVTAFGVNQAGRFAIKLIAADGGADVALALGQMPDAVIGDFDSVSDAARQAIPAARQFPIAEQDSTDFEKCLIHTQAPFYLALGFTGKRLDHTLAAMTVLARHPQQPVILIGSEDLTFLAPAEVHLPLAPGCRVSLYPMGPVTGRSTGLRWPIDGLALSPAGRVSTSNEATGPVSLWLDGPCLVMLPCDALGLVLEAMGLAT